MSGKRRRLTACQSGLSRSSHDKCVKSCENACEIARKSKDSQCKSEFSRGIVNNMVERAAELPYSRVYIVEW